MRFTLTIELGNEAMRTYGDIHELLTRALRGQMIERAPKAGEGRPIHDVNGNKVGTWAVEADAQARTVIGNTPTCEDCGEALDHCTCE